MIRIIIVNILQLIFHDLKNEKRKHKKKIINLLKIFNTTYIYFTYPKNIYLYKFQRFVNNRLFRYYKDYVYKAQLEYPFVKESPFPAELGFSVGNYFEEYDPIQFKMLPDICERKRILL